MAKLRCKKHNARVHVLADRKVVHRGDHEKCEFPVKMRDAEISEDFFLTELRLERIMRKMGMTTEKGE